MTPTTRSATSIIRTAVATLFAGALTLTTGLVRAAWIAIDDPKWGPDSVVQDTSSGLEWLNLRATIGLPPARVYAGLRPEGEFAGFRCATAAEVHSLTSRFFSVPRVCCYRPLDKVTTANFANLFGPTFTVTKLSETNPGVDGYFGFAMAGYTEGIIGAFFYESNAVGQLDGVYDQSGGITLASRGTPSRGSYIVRSVSEPGVLALIGTALLGAVAGLRRRRPVQLARLARTPFGGRALLRTLDVAQLPPRESEHAAEHQHQLDEDQRRVLAHGALRRR